MTDSRAERRAALIAVALIAPFVALALLLHFDEWPFQSAEADIVGSFRTSWLGVEGHEFWVRWGRATERWVILCAFAVLTIWMVIRRRIRQALWIVVAGLVSTSAWGSLKAIIERPRPGDGFGGFSFPSGHSTNIAALVTVGIVLTHQGIRSRRRRRLLVGVWLFVGLLTGADRIFLAAHYPSDVIGGWLLGTFIVFVLALVFGVVSTDRRDPEPQRPLSSVPEDRRSLAVVMNPIKVGDADVFRSRIATAVRNAGWDEPLWFETSIEDAGQAMARAAVAAGADVVMAAGGDGTVRVVCGVVAGTGVPVGILPVGTGNLLARNLQLPLNLDEALDVVLNGQDRAIDLVRVEGDDLPATYSMVMAGLGLDAAIMEGAPDQLKAKMGWIAYVVSALKQVRYPAVRVTISMDGAEPVQRRARTVVVGNVGSLQAGIPLLPDAEIDDGVLDVVVVAPVRVFGWLGLIYRVILRRRRTDERLDRFTGRQVVITAAHPTPRQLDGDTVAAGTELRCEIQPGRLLVRVPR